ncbi:conserved hypothetical protein [Hyphomicrobiales bacterium]|nr:conserved hypothetical protein [Hyphomicrobiales bacterium]CAH1691445.1 conserved hypothetical protein [Hyphomicrobiales bacterium]
MHPGRIIVLKSNVLRGLAIIGLGLVSAAVAAADYPKRAIRLVVPYVPGGVTDSMARLLAQKLSERVGQPVVVENKPGAGGVIGAENVIGAAPDGHSLLFGTVTLTVYPSYEKNFTYDIHKDLAPITITSNAPYVISVSKDSPFKTLDDLIQYAKANPNKLNFGSPGVGTSTHLAFEYFLKAADIKMVHVPYKGSAATLPALMSGEVQANMDTYIGIAGAVESGQIRPLAITSKERAAFNPSIPTADEAGLKNFTVDTWFGVFAPGKTPSDIVAKLNTELVEVLKDPQVVKNFTSQGSIIANSSEAFAQVLVDDEKKWAKVIEDAGLKTQ